MGDRWTRGSGVVVLAGMVLLASAGAEAQQVLLAGSPASPAVARLAEGLERGEPGAAVAFWRVVERRGAPLVEPAAGHPGHSLVTFLYRAADPAVQVELESNIASLDAESRFASRLQLSLEHLVGSDVRYLTFRLRNDIRAPYRFRVRAPGTEVEAQADPLNPRVWEPEQRALHASILELPGARPQPWRSAGSEAGDWDELALADVAGAERRVYVYKPAGWRADGGEPYPALVGLGAFGTGIGMRVDRMADHLIAAGLLRPMVFLLVDLRREDEASRYSSVDAFVADVVLPYVREHYGVSVRPDDVAVSGTSRRGLVAALMALRRPDAVGRVISLSGSYYWKPSGEAAYAWLPAEYARRGRRAVRLYVAAGELETYVNPGNAGHYLVGTNRHFRDVLRARGYDLTYVEFNGVHSELNWQDWLADALVRYFGMSAR